MKLKCLLIMLPIFALYFSFLAQAQTNQNNTVFVSKADKEKYEQAFEQLVKILPPGTSRGFEYLDYNSGFECYVDVDVLGNKDSYTVAIHNTSSSKKENAVTFSLNRNSKSFSLKPDQEKVVARVTNTDGDPELGSWNIVQALSLIHI